MPSSVEGALDSLRQWIRAGVRMVRAAGDHFGVTVSGGLLLASAIVGWLLARWLGSKALFLLVYGSIIVVAIACALGRRRVSIDAVRSELSPRVRTGQQVEVVLQLSAKRRVSNVIIEEQLPPQLATSVRVPITELPARKKVEHIYRFSPRTRGVYEIGPMMVTWGDPFGLTRRKARLTGTTELIVHPITEPVQDRVATREWEDPPVRPPVSKPWPTGFEFYGMRDYSVGDDPRRINWRASARHTDPLTGMGRLLVQESEQGITDRVCLILDTDVRRHSPTSPGHPSDTFEAAVRIVASLGARHLRDGFSVTVEANGGQMFDRLRGQRNRMRLLDELARVEMEKTPLATTVRRLAADHRRLNLHNVLVTAHLDADTASYLRPLAARASMLVALVMWPDSDPDSLRRASSLGCKVVEVEPGMPLEKAFRRVVGAGVRREH